MDIGIKQDGGIVTVTVASRMDALSAQSLHRETTPLIEGAARGIVLT